MNPSPLILGATLAAGFLGVSSSLSSREADEQFLFDQRHPRAVPSAAVEAAVRTAPEPRRPPRPEGVSARCIPRGSGELRNPWICRVRYRSGRVGRYRVVISGDGRFAGDYAGRENFFEGCCVEGLGVRP